MLKPMFLNLRTLANACMSLPVVSVERSFSKMKMIKLDSETDYLKKSFLLNENLNRITTKID